LNSPSVEFSLAIFTDKPLEYATLYYKHQPPNRKLKQKSVCIQNAFYF